MGRRLLYRGILSPNTQNSAQQAILLSALVVLRRKNSVFTRNRKAAGKVVFPLRIVVTNSGRGTGRSGILVNMVQVFLLGRDYGN